jgi:DNA-binding NarL/FixJ family response regulator
MLSQTTSLAIVDDHALFGQALKSYLSEQKNFTVLIQSSEILDLLDKLKSIPVDILLMSLHIPGLAGVDAIRTIRFKHPSIKIIVVSKSTDLAIISDLLDSGIHGYISQSEELEALLQIIQDISQNRICRGRLFTEALYWNRQNALKLIRDKVHEELNEREKKIIRLLWEEKSNKEIADELFIGIRTIERTRQEMKEKVGVKSTVGLIKFAIQKKIIYGDFLALNSEQPNRGAISSR